MTRLPLADATFPQIPPEDTFRINYDLTVWVNPWTGVRKYPADLHTPDLRWLFLHHGGGRNPAGELVVDPELTWAQRVLVHFGVARTVLRSWEQYHVGTKGWSGIAYNYAVTQYGRVYRLRGWRRNAGQWGGTPSRWNDTSIAVVWVGGEGQTMRWPAWRALGRLWLEASYALPAGRALRLEGHRFTNYDTPREYQTSCPGDERTRQIADGMHLQALGRLRVRKVPMRGPTVRSLTRGLMLAGYWPTIQRTYSRRLAEAVRRFQTDHRLQADGIVGPVTWQKLAEAVSTEGARP